MAATLSLLSGCARPPNLCDGLWAVREIPRVEAENQTFQRIRAAAARAADTALRAETATPSTSALSAVGALAETASKYTACLNAAGITTGSDFYDATLRGATVGAEAAAAQSGDQAESRGIVAAGSAAYAAARRYLRQRRRDDGLFAAARASGSAAALRQFLRDEPGHRREAEIEAELAAAGAVVCVGVPDEASCVEIFVHATTAPTANLALRNLKPTPVGVVVPVGTVFAEKKWLRAE